MTGAWGAIVVAGGAGSRLGGVSKPDLELAGIALLDRALAAVAGARQVVLVGGPRREGVTWTVEDPPGSGPAAAIAAGMAALGEAPAPWTAVLAVDTPRAAEALPALLAARERDGAWLVDAAGHAQHLLAVYRTAALAERCARDLAGASVRSVVGGLDMVAVRDRDGLARDLDTWDDADYWDTYEWKERLP